MPRRMNRLSSPGTVCKYHLRRVHITSHALRRSLRAEISRSLWDQPSIPRTKCMQTSAATHTSGRYMKKFGDVEKNKSTAHILHGNPRRCFTGRPLQELGLRSCTSDLFRPLRGNYCAGAYQVLTDLLQRALI